MDKYDRKNPLYMEFVARGALDWQAKYLSARLSSAFGNNLRGVLDNFWERGWRAHEIWELDRSNKVWRRQVQSLFVIHDMLAALGCPVHFTAIVLSSACLFRLEDSDRNKTENISVPRTVWGAICAMREAGYKDEDIRILLSGYPMAFLNTRERILEWCQETQRSGGHYYLTIRELVRHPRRIHVSRSLTRSLASEREADMPRVEQMLPPEIPSVAQAAVIAPLETPAIPEPANSVVISEAPRTDEPTLDSFSATLPADVVPESQPEPVPEVSVVEIHQEPPRESHTQEVKTAVKIPAPPPVPKIPVIKRVTSLPPLRTFKASEPPQPKEPSPPPYEPEDLAHNWPVLANVILAHAVPDWSSEKWMAWVEKNTWINSTRSTETRALEQLFSWVAFSTASPPHDRRVKLIASVLLGKDLITKTKRRRGSDKPQDPKFALDQILKLSEEALYFRFYVLRRIVMRHPERHPDALTYPFEQVEKFELPNGHGFSVPPPPMDDENAWKAKAAELRWRVHEIERRGRNYQCNLKPFVLMLFARRRKTFLKRLDRYEAEHGTASRRVLRRNNSAITPFSSLA